MREPQHGTCAGTCCLRRRCLVALALFRQEWSNPAAVCVRAVVVVTERARHMRGRRRTQCLRRLLRKARGRPRRAHALVSDRETYLRRRHPRHRARALSFACLTIVLSNRSEAGEDEHLLACLLSLFTVVNLDDETNERLCTQNGLSGGGVGVVTVCDGGRVASRRLSDEDDFCRNITEVWRRQLARSADI